MKNILSILMVFALIGMAAANNAGDPTIFHPHSAIPVTAAGWSTSTGTNDCNYDYATGWTYDTWVLTLSEAKDVTISAADCCCVGDYFEILVDDVVVGTTPVPSAWGCISGGYSGISSGSATVSLMPGTYTIKVRDKGFQAHTAVQIAAENMCGAGYTVSGSTGPYSGTTVPETAAVVGLIALLTPGMIYLVRRKR